jgi:hypothetical protein
MQGAVTFSRSWSWSCNTEAHAPVPAPGKNKVKYGINTNLIFYIIFKLFQFFFLS